MKADIKTKKRKSSQNRLKELRQKNDEDINKLSASRNQKMLLQGATLSTQEYANSASRKNDSSSRKRNSMMPKLGRPEMNTLTVPRM